MTGQRYPLSLDLTGKPAVVVGGGQVALRRARALLNAGAQVTVIAPEVAPELARLAPTGPAPTGPARRRPALTTPMLTVKRRRYRHGDLAGAWLAHAATGDPDVNAAVAAEAHQRRIWCVRADAADASAAWTPAVSSHGDVSVAVTAGGDPRRAQRLRAAISMALADGTLPLRHVRRGPADRSESAGSVALVGGGPGHPELITVLGRRLLAEADVVVVDKLAPRALLAELDPAVEVIDAGKAPHAHNLTQPEINALIVERARAGQRVVRLKGGDPFVFGRGGEEALACVRAGVPFRVVPGVTSAIAVPAWVGIPVTHRGITQDFAVVSAHLDPAQHGPGGTQGDLATPQTPIALDPPAPGATVDWAALATGPGTLVLLMAVAHLDRVANELIKRGRDAATPVAVISDGTTADQQVVTCTLGDLADEQTRPIVSPPAIVVVGEVVRLRELLAAA